MAKLTERLTREKEQMIPRSEYDQKERYWIDHADALKAELEGAINALHLYDVYYQMSSDRGGKNGPKGKAYQAFIDAKDAALSTRRAAA